jgi:hypothetical protein
MIHHSGLWGTWDRISTGVWLASRSSLTAPWQNLGRVTNVPPSPYYDPALADLNGVMHLFWVFGTSIVGAPINTAALAVDLTQQKTYVLQAAAGTSNSPTPILDKNGELLGFSHHDVTGSDNDHYFSFDLLSSTQALLWNDTTTWINNGSWTGGRFFDAQSSPSYRLWYLDSYWFTGGRAKINTTMDLASYIVPSTAVTPVLSFFFISAAYTPTPLPAPAPPLGAFGLSANPLLFFTLGLNDRVTGRASLGLLIPNDASLSGKAIPAQAFSFDPLNAMITLSNTAALTIE